MASPIPIGSRRQLFLDGHLIEWRDRMTRRVCPATKSSENPVIRPREDWEPAGYVAYGSVLYDAEERLYKAWVNSVGEPRGHAHGDCSAKGGLFHFISEDGIHWERPELDVFPLEGRPTNIVALSRHSDHPRCWPYCYELFGVSLDPTDPEPSRRYKLGYLYLNRDYHGPLEDARHPGELRALGVALSPDGVHWTNVEDPVTQATRDGATHWFYDRGRGRFVLYGRGRHVDPAVQRLYGERLFFQRNNSGRAVKRAESEDFLHWTPDQGELVLAVDALDGPGDEIYGMSVFPYEGIYIGLVQMFHNYEDRLYLDVQLAVSRDSVHFERLSDRSAFIPVGGVGAWDRFNNSVANSEPIAAGDELRFYYGGRNYLHSGVLKGPDNGAQADIPFRAGVGMGTIKRDRFAALEASFEAGTLRTKPLVFEGARLHVNADVEFGLLEVTVLDADGGPLEGMRARVRGQDSVDVPVPLDGLAALSGKPVRLEFTLQNGHLYSFWVE